MMKLIRIATFAAISLAGAADAYAGVSTVAECYDLVIADCNKGDHAQSCAGSGMDQCDKVFPTPMTRNPSLVFGTQPADADRTLSSNNLKQIGMALR